MLRIFKKISSRTKTTNMLTDGGVREELNKHNLKSKTFFKIVFDIGAFVKKSSCVTPTSVCNYGLLFKRNYFSISFFPMIYSHIAIM